MDKVSLSTVLIGVLLSAAKTKKYNVRQLVFEMLLASETWLVCVERLGWVSEENINKIKEEVKEKANEQVNKTLDQISKVK